jgi:hypothetical protein
MKEYRFTIANIVNMDNHEALSGAISIARKAI